MARVSSELVASRVDLLLVGGTSGAMAAQKATATIPIVIFSASDPVGTAHLRHRSPTWWLGPLAAPGA